jgi:hypothetical protein
MLLVGHLKKNQHLIHFSFDSIMEVPITEKELDKIIEILKNTNEKDLYSKLWSFKFNQKQKNGFFKRNCKRDWR